MHRDHGHCLSVANWSSMVTWSVISMLRQFGVEARWGIGSKFGTKEQLGLGRRISEEDRGACGLAAKIQTLSLAHRLDRPVQGRSGIKCGQKRRGHGGYRLSASRLDSIKSANDISRLRVSQRIVVTSKLLASSTTYHSMRFFNSCNNTRNWQIEG